MKGKSIFGVIMDFIAWVLLALGLWVPLVFSFAFLVICAVAGVPLVSVGTVYLAGLAFCLLCSVIIVVSRPFKKFRAQWREEDADFAPPPPSPAPAVRRENRPEMEGEGRNLTRRSRDRFGAVPASYSPPPPPTPSRNDEAYGYGDARDYRNESPRRGEYAQREQYNSYQHYEPRQPERRPQQQPQPLRAEPKKQRPALTVTDHSGAAQLPPDINGADYPRQSPAPNSDMNYFAGAFQPKNAPERPESAAAEHGQLNDGVRDYGTLSGLDRLLQEEQRERERHINDGLLTSPEFLRMRAKYGDGNAGSSGGSETHTYGGNVNYFGAGYESRARESAGGAVESGERAREMLFGGGANAAYWKEPCRSEQDNYYNKSTLEERLLYPRPEKRGEEPKIYRTRRDPDILIYEYNDRLQYYRKTAKGLKLVGTDYFEDMA